MIARRLLVLLLGFGLVLVILAVPAPASAQGGCDRFVLGIDTSDTGDCSDETAPCETIQYAIDQAVGGDTICVASHALAGPLVYNESLSITQSITLDGAWVGMCVDPSNLTCTVDPTPCNPANVTIDAGGMGRAITIDGSGAPGTVAPTIRCVTITGGDADGLGGDPGGSHAGGGIFSRDAAPIIANSIITGNFGCDVCSGSNGCGGGIYLLNAPDTAIVRDSVIAHNVADNTSWGRGGGVMLRDSDAQIVDNVIEENRAGASAGDGGGVAVFGGAPTIRDNEVLDNIGGLSGRGQGGGIYGEGGTLEISGNLIAKNLGSLYDSAFGGGVALTETTALLRGNRLISNTATLDSGGQGGGIYGGFGTYEVVGNVISGNLASAVNAGNGGGVYFQFDSVWLEGNTITNNSASPGVIAAGGGVRLAVVDPFTVTNNVIAGNGPAREGAGIAILNGTDGKLAHNTIVNNRGGDGIGVFVKGSSNVTLTNNIVTDHHVGVKNASPGTAVVTVAYTLFESNLTDAEDVVSTADVAAPAALLPNYHLSPSSNAIDAGLTLGWVTQDIDRETRPSGSVSDVGADEYACRARTGGVDYLEVQQAVDAAATSAIVKVAEGTCYENVSINKTVTLQGGWWSNFLERYDDPAAHTTINGLGAGRVISMSAPEGQRIEPIIDGLTLTGGDATGLRGSIYTADIGGGVFGIRANAIVRDCIIQDNVASTNYIGWGGGLGFYMSDVVLEDNLVTGNTASETSNGYGGGIALRSGTSRLATNTVTANTASKAGLAYGGGIWLAQTNATLQDNAVLGNTASTAGRGYGGGIHAFMAPQVTMTGDDVTGNVASGGTEGYGGGVSADRGKLVLDGVSLGENYAITFGGGLYADESTVLQVVSSDVVSNSAGMGGGFYLTGVDTPLVSGTVITGNSAGYAGGGLVMGGSGLVFEDSWVLNNRSAGLAGGLWVSGSADAMLRRNRFVGNTAEGDGGGVFLLGGDEVWLENNIIAGNYVEAGGAGAGMCLDESTAHMVHTTVAQNTGGDGSGIHVGLTSSVWMTNTIVVSHTVGITVTGGSSASTMTTLWGDGEWANLTDWGGAGAVTAVASNVVGHPGFINPSQGDYRIRGGAAVDAAVYAGVDDDVDGHARPIGDGYDIGAHEAYLPVFMPIIYTGF